MKKLIVAIVVAAGLIGIVRLSAIDFFFNFLLTGAIPGTEYTVAPQTMLGIAIGGMLLAVFYLIPFSFLPKPSQKKTKKTIVSKKKKSAKSNLPRRRYSEI